jgi:hypothetical protein
MLTSSQKELLLRAQVEIDERIEAHKRLEQQLRPFQEAMLSHRRIEQQLRPVQQAVEAQRRIERQLRPFQDIMEQQRRIERQLGRPIPDVLDQQRITQEKRNLALDQATFLSHVQLAEQIKAIHSPEWLQDSRRAAIVLRGEFDKHQKLTAAFSQPIRKAVEGFDVWHQRLNRSINESVKNSELFQSLRALGLLLDQFGRLTEAVRIHQLDTQHPALAERLFAPSTYFSDYTSNAVQRLNEIEGEKNEAVLQTALSLAESEFAESSFITESLLESEIAIVAPSSPIIYNLYEEQESELIYLVSRDGNIQIEDIPSLFSLMRTKEIAELTREVLNLVATCNQESRTRGGEDIFKLTNAMLEAAADLPMLVVKNKESLVSLVRHLFRILYEGAGDKYLRFLSANGGCLEDGECNAIWNLKALRNKLTLHDPEHGKPSDVRKSYTTLGEALAKLGMSGMPVKEDEFLTLQKSLLSQVKVFLTQLAIKLRR